MSSFSALTSGYFSDPQQYERDKRPDREQRQRQEDRQKRDAGNLAYAAIIKVSIHAYGTWSKHEPLLGVGILLNPSCCTSSSTYQHPQSACACRIPLPGVQMSKLKLQEVKPLVQDYAKTELWGDTVTLWGDTVILQSLVPARLLRLTNLQLLEQGGKSEGPGF